MKRILWIGFSLGLLCSCSTRQSPVTEKSVPAEPSIISGRIIGYKSLAPALARVDVYEPGRLDVPDRIEAARDGAYSVSTTKTGVVRLSFVGAFHNTFSIPVLLLKPSHLKIDVRLAPCEWDNEFKEIIVIGDFNLYSRTSGYTVMVKQPDGTYATELANLAGEKMGYRLIGLVKGSTRSVPGTQYDDLVSDPGGGIISRTTIRNGRVRIVFDPALLPRGGPDAGVTFEDNGSVIARIAALDVDMRKRQEEFARATAQFTRFGNKSRDFRYDWSKTVAGLRRQIGEEKDPVIRQMLYISLLDLNHLRAEEVDAETAKQALAVIPPESPLWGLAPSYLLLEAVKLAGLGADGNYIQAVVTRHPSREVRALILEQAYGNAMSLLDLERAQEYYKRLTTDFGDLISEGVKARPPELKIATGKIMPEFSFASLDDPSRMITNDTFKGKCYLVNFWATWSEPSVAQIETLQKVYERYRMKDFQILSLSFDNSPRDIRRFREKRWAMPWFHGFIGRDEFRPGSRTNDYFEVPEIPKSILVGKDGRITAVGRELLGGGLEKHLGKLIGD
jgi:thiol-disulfide isomerase/thioredoxin